MTSPKTHTTLAIDRETFEKLAELARKNDRTASAEARRALRKHVEEASCRS